MKSLRLLLASIALAGVFSAAGPAAAAEKLDALLEKTRTARTLQAQQNTAREKEFLARKEQQAELLREAISKRDAAEARSKQLSARFDANEVELAQREELMTQRLGTLGELFGVVRQVAGDGSPVLYNSLISAQYPGRDAFFTELGKAKSLPSMEQLERLWFEIQREMTESGRVVRFETAIVDADGAPKTAPVVRIGSFLAVSDGRYLNYLPSVGKLGVLSRQPSDDLTKLAASLEAAQNGHVAAAVDPSRGVLLSLIVQRPSVMERIEKGEAVGYVIIVVGLIATVLAFYQAYFLIRTRRAVRRQLADLAHPRDDNPLGRVLTSFRADPESIEEDAELAELRISEAVLREVPRLERFQSFLRLAVAAGPLLGLIGTVIGMIITFQSITESGSSDPRLMANGIGQAMIATVLGLGIAVPLLFINAGLASMSRYVVQVLDEQSTGLLAESVERQRSNEQFGRRVHEALRVFDAVLAAPLWLVGAVTDLVDEGGPFVFWIFLCGFVMWTLVIERLWYFARVLPRQAHETVARWRARDEHSTWCAREIRRAMISRVQIEMTANQLLLRVLVPLSPLLGLVGTVSGMLEVFDSMALSGSADARAMASGVSHAMICTLTGLAVSITGLYPAFYFQSRTRRETELLADQLGS